MNRCLTWIVLGMAVAGLSGCYRLNVLGKMLVLDRISKDKERMQAELDTDRERFERVAAAYRDNRLVQGTPDQDILESYGAPIYTREKRADGITYEQWLYRQGRPWDSDKIYLYFGKDEKLLRWEFIEHREEVKNGKGQQETPAEI